MMAMFHNWNSLNKILLANFLTHVVVRLGFAVIRILMFGTRFSKMAIFAEAAFMLINIFLARLIYIIDLKKKSSANIK